RRPCPRAERRRHRGGRGLQRPGGGAGAEGWVGAEPLLPGAGGAGPRWRAHAEPR
ncbi:unnamed protein product, partial [Effrenium voratum]